jgi:hypothetical protein
MATQILHNPSRFRSTKSNCSSERSLEELERIHQVNAKEIIRIGVTAPPPGAGTSPLNTGVDGYS